MSVLLPLGLALAAAPVTVLAGLVRPRWAAWAGAAMAGLAFAATAWGWAAGGGAVDLSWSRSWGLRLGFSLDGLAALYALLATGIGCAVALYAAPYIRHHLEAEGRSESGEVRFFGLLLLFLGAMAGLVMAQDLLLLFFFWDLTAVASYFLIGFDRHRAESRDGALIALVVTAGSAVFLLLGAVMLGLHYGTWQIAELAARAEPGAPLTTAMALIAVAALAKSAQIPLHFWLPRAMAAPTPVSAYLHSAAMVAAGVFLLSRLHPLLVKSGWLPEALAALGVVAMLTAGFLALTGDKLKEILAYSTIAQYGYVVAMLGWGGEAGAAGAALYVLSHGLFKSSLFMTAGAVTQATGEDHLSRLGGLRRPMLPLALGSGVAAAALAALPLTLGFFKDELFFKAAVERGGPYPALAVAGAGLSLAYIGRFWTGLFLGERRALARPVPAGLVVPVAVLGALLVAGGIVPGPFARLAEAAGRVTLEAPAHAGAGYHLDARPENLMALASWILGGLLLVSLRHWSAAAGRLAGLAGRLGPERWYRAGLAGLDHLSGALYGRERRDLRSRLATILVPAALLLATGFVVTGGRQAYRLGTLEAADLPLACGLSLAILAALMTVRHQSHLTLVLTLSSAGYSLAVVYAFFGGPDVALVAVLVETVLTLLFLAVLALLPRQILEEERLRPTRGSLRWRDPLVGGIAAAAAFAVAWRTLSHPPPPAGAAFTHLARAEDAHARNVVTAILADFRGLDTMGEITVVAVALLGLTLLLRAGEARR